MYDLISLTHMYDLIISYVFHDSAGPAPFCTYTYTIIHTQYIPAQGCTNRTLIGHERVDSRFLVLLGSDSIFTEITEYIYFSLILTRVEFRHKSD